MANAPGCTQVIPASIWIEYIFKNNAAALSTLIVLYILILFAYILYTLQIDALSAYNNIIHHLTHSFQRSSFYRAYYIPYIHHYGSKCLLFIILLPMSLMYFDSLFRYRNDCNSITNAWIIFSIIFMLQFWYLSIKFILYNPQFIAIKYDPRRTSTFGGTDWNEIGNNTSTTNISYNQFQQNNIQPQQQLQEYTQPKYTHKSRQESAPNFKVQYVQPSPSPGPFPELGYGPNNSGNQNDNHNQPPPAYQNENVIGESGHEYNNPSIPSMNAPKPIPMQDNNEYVEYFEEEDTGAKPDYNPFDSDYNEQENDEKDSAPIIVNHSSNGEDYVVIPHYKISVIDEVVSSNTYNTAIPGQAYIQPTHGQTQQNGPPPPPPPPPSYNETQSSQQYEQPQYQPQQNWQQQETQAALPTNVFNGPPQTHLPPPQPRTPSRSMVKQEESHQIYQPQQEQDEMMHNANVVSQYENQVRFSESKNSQNIEAAEYLRVIEMKKFVKYFKTTTIFLMILSPFIMATTWMFIPYYALNTSSYVYFYLFAAPFVIIYRINMRFMNGDYYNHYNYTNLLNDFPFVLFLLKISSVNIIFSFCVTMIMDPLDHKQQIVGIVLLFILPILSIYPWIILGKISVSLRSIYEKFEGQHSASNDYTFIKPIIPFGQIPHITPSGAHDELNIYLRQPNPSEPKVMYDQQNDPKKDRLESIDLTGNDDAHSEYAFRNSKNSVHNTVMDVDISTTAKLKRVASQGAVHYSNNRHWVINITLILLSLISIIAGGIEISITKKQMNSSCSADLDEKCFEAINGFSAAREMVFFAVMLLLMAIYTIMVGCCCGSSKKGFNTKAYLMSSDTKQRLTVWITVMMLVFNITIILITKQDGTKAIFTILSFISVIFLAVLTLNKKYKVLIKLPFKNTKVFMISYMISYFASISCMFIMILHAISMSGEQLLPIYSYVGLSLLWLFWTLLYNNEIRHFISELNYIPNMQIEDDEQDVDVFNMNKSVEKSKSENSKHMPTTYGSLYLLNELSMTSSFMVFIICCAMASKSYDGAEDAGSTFFLSIYLMLSCVICINSFIAMLSMQPNSRKVYRAAAFEPVLKESLLTQQM